MGHTVFISHRGSDSAVAERLAIALRAAQLTVWLDEWAIDIGDSIVKRVGDGLGDTGFLVLCCSAAGTDAPWMSREWMSALARHLEGEDIVVLPVLLDGGSPPAILADIKYADLSKDFDAGVEALIRRIERG